jgi:hypothetical protein
MALSASCASVSFALYSLLVRRKPGCVTRRDVRFSIDRSPAEEDNA